MERDNINGNVYLDNPYVPSRDSREINAVARLKEIQGIPHTFVKDDDVQEGELDTALKTVGSSLSNEFIPTSKIGTAGGVVPLNEDGLIDDSYLPTTTTGIAALSLAGTEAQIVGHTAIIPVTSDTCAGLLSCEDKSKLDGIPANIVSTVNNQTGDVTLTAADLGAVTTTTFNERIAEEVTARETADNTLQGNINAEVTARETADTTLQTNINEEKSARETADNTLQTSINTEVTNRATADNALSTRIDNLTMPRVPEVGTFTNGSKTYNALFTNGCAVTIVDDGTQNVAYYQTIDTTTKSINFPYNSQVLGGNLGKSDKFYTFDSSFITINSGKLNSVYAGCRAYGTVADSTIIVNGGTCSSIIGGGASPNATENTSVGNTHIIINGGTTSLIYGGGMGGSTVGTVEIEINGGTHGWVTAGGSNGVTGIARVKINGGTITCFQTVNRGSINHAEVTVTGGTITNMYAGGETSDSGVTGKCEKTILHIAGGIITLNKGTYGGVEDATRCSGDYVVGVIDTTSASNCNLTIKTGDLDKLQESLTTTTTVGNVPSGTVFPAGTSLLSIINQILRADSPTPPPTPTTDHVYYAITDNIPSIAGMSNPAASEQVVTSDAPESATTFTHAYNNGEAEDAQYFSIAYPSSLGNLTSILDAISSQQISNFTKIVDSGYNIYYIGNMWTEDDMNFTFSF